MTASRVHQRAGVVSAVGPRERNEDSFLLRDTTLDHGLVLARLAVADGMGGHEAGEVASRLAVECAARCLEGGTSDPDALRRAFELADAEIREFSRTRGNGASMGTTLTFTVVREDEAIVGHVGDSRAWLFHRGELKQITVDHSRVGRLLRSGVISEQETIGHPEANVLDQALGAGTVPQADVYRVGVGPGDVLVLSTDGLHGVLGRAEIEGVLREQSSMQQACVQLAALAQERGSTDNVTVLAWQYPALSSRTRTNPGTVGRAAQSPRLPRGFDVRWRLLAGGFTVGLVIGVLLRVLA